MSCQFHPAFIARLILALAISLLATSVPEALAEVKVAVVDVQQVLENTKSGKETTATIAEFVQRRQAVIASDEAELRTMEQEIKKDVKSPMPDKEEKYQRRLAGYQQDLVRLEQEIQVKKRDLLGGFSKRVEDVVAKLAEKQKISMVLQMNNDMTGVLYNQSSIDLTDQVIKELEKLK